MATSLVTVPFSFFVGPRTIPQAGSRESRLEGVAGLAVGGFAEREDLRRCDAEDESLATVGIAERPFADLEIPVELRLPDGRQPLELRVVGHASGSSLDHDVQPRPELVGTGREDAMGIGLQVLGFLLGGAGAEVERPVEPDRRERRDVRSPDAPSTARTSLTSTAPRPPRPTAAPLRPAH